MSSPMQWPEWVIRLMPYGASLREPGDTGHSDQAPFDLAEGGSQRPSRSDRRGKGRAFHLIRPGDKSGTACRSRVGRWIKYPLAHRAGIAPKSLSLPLEAARVRITCAVSILRRARLTSSDRLAAGFSMRR